MQDMPDVQVYTEAWVLRLQARYQSMAIRCKSLEDSFLGVKKENDAFRTQLKQQRQATKRNKAYKRV